MTLDTKHFKDLLTKELRTIEGELGTIGRKNPESPSGWEAVDTDDEKDHAEEGDTAEDIEQYEYNSAEANQLETQLKEVKDALEKIEDDSYGVCEVCNEPIELDRLEANPSARTCKAHMNS